MRKKLNIGILGCANIAKKYAIRAFQALETVDKIFIASREKSKSEKWATDFHIRAKDSYNSLIEDSGIDAVYIPLPIGLHEEWALRAVRSRKHVLCEKSLSHTLLSAKKIVDSCRENGLVLFENFMCDYHPQHDAVLSLIHKKEIGDVFAFKGYFGFPYFNKDSFRYDKKLGGGSLNDAGAYPVFMARKILESEPLAVTCHLEEHPNFGVDIRGSAYLEFPENKNAFVAFGFDNVYQNNYSVWGSKGLLSVDRAYSIPPDMEPFVTLYKNENQQSLEKKIPVAPASHFELIFGDFCKTVLDGDRAKREKKYDQIISQAVVLEAMRISSSTNEKTRIETVNRNV